MPKEQAVVHILVIWHSAMHLRKKIIQDLNENFQILKVFRGHWDKKKWLDNWFVFYAHSQQHRKYIDYLHILYGKMKLCKTGDFEVVVFKDSHPLFEKRKTSSGERLVNTRIFDKKVLYREWTGGGSKIHASDDAWETNKDLTLMFGKNTEDFCNYYKEEFANLKETHNKWKEDSFHKNCIGVSGYENIQQFFYVLNNTIKYCVLRNHEPIPEQYTVEGHGDIDLLVENKNYIAYLTLAKPVFPKETRVYHYIDIGGSKIPFDFRFIGDAYYDEPWQKDILETRILTKKLFYTPNPEHQFHSLLYHAYVQKDEIKPDYFPKLEKYAEEIGLHFQATKEYAFAQMDKFMEQHKYEYIRPIDKSVKFNTENLKYSSYACRNGICIRRNSVNDECVGDFNTLVYKKENSYIKSGTSWLIDNEAIFLKKLAATKKFPEVISHFRCDEKTSSLEISTMPGIAVGEFFSERKNCTKKNLAGFLMGAIENLSILHKYKILHRDIQPDNFLIDTSNKQIKVSLIDFAWATDYENQSSRTPARLCIHYSTNNDKTDPHELGKLLKYEWRMIPTCRKISKKLLHVKSVTDLAPDFYDNLKKDLQHFSLLDSFAIKIYSLTKWNRLKMAVKKRTLLKARSGNLFWNKLLMFLEFARFHLKKR